MLGYREDIDKRRRIRLKRNREHISANIIKHDSYPIIEDCERIGYYAVYRSDFDIPINKRAPLPFTTVGDGGDFLAG